MAEDTEKLASAPGAAGIGKGLDNAADKNERRHASGMARASQKSGYARELGDQLAAHAQEPGVPFPGAESKGGKPNPGTEPDKRLKENH